MPTVLLSGYYGFHNIGDEAVLGGILAGLRARLPAVRPVVLSGDPAGTEALHDVEAVPRGALVRALHEADLFASGGGSLLQDVTSLRSPFFYLLQLWAAQRMPVPTMILAQGLGPLRNPAVRAATRRILNHTRAITVRDAGSEAFLLNLGVTVPPIEVTADPSFLLEPDVSERLEEWWAAYVPADRPVIGVALRRWDRDEPHARYHAISDALATLAAETGAFLVFIPMQHGADLPVALQVSGWTPAENRVCDLPLGPREMLALVARSQFVVAMRLHTLIFAVQQGVPAYGLSYDPKVTDFAREAGLPAPMPWAAIQDAPLLDDLRTCWTAREKLQTLIRTRAAELQERAWRNIAVLGELV
jgi:polysaccharide pyruvyl transferase CsaB